MTQPLRPRDTNMATDPDSTLDTPEKLESEWNEGQRTRATRLRSLQANYGFDTMITANKRGNHDKNTVKPRTDQMYKDWVKAEQVEWGKHNEDGALPNLDNIIVRRRSIFETGTSLLGIYCDAAQYHWLNAPTYDGSDDAVCDIY